MKSTFIASTLLFGLFISAGAAAEEVNIEGEWQLVSAELTLGGETRSIFDPVIRSMIKIITDSHFAFVSKGSVRPHFNSYQLTPEEKSVAFDNFGGGGGRYTLEGKQYTEHVEYSSYPNYEGMSLIFTVSVEGDTLVQEGTYPIKELGLGSENGYLKETYKRIP
jgi:hypothetical protein